MVRGPAALLAACALALAYFVAAGALPDIGSGDVAVIVAAGAGLLAVALIALALAWAGQEIAPAILLALGGGLLMGALDVAGTHSAAVVPEAVFAAAFGVLLARALVAYAGTAVALAVPLFVALVDIWSVAAGPSSRLIDGDPRGISALTFDLPWWGGALDGPAARLGLPDVIFLAAFATWSLRLDLRPRATAVAMVVALLATLVLSVAADRAIPALPLLAAGYLLVNIDRVEGLLRPRRRANVRLKPG